MEKIINKTVNIALQIVPRTKEKHIYEVIDKAIEVIEKSGIKHMVCPMETVMEGDYYEIMEIINKAVEVVYPFSDAIFVSIKMQINTEEDVSMDEKIEKYL